MNICNKKNKFLNKYKISCNYSSDIDRERCNLALFLNHKPGLEVAKYFQDRIALEDIRVLYLTGKNAELDNKIAETLNVNSDRVFYGSEVVKDPAHIVWLKEQKIDALICVYWPWLLKDNIYTTAKKTINFHPALLPVNRGWFPHVHSLMDGSPTGVTLHEIERGADTGCIWAQRNVAVHPTDTAKEIYDRLQGEIVSLFKEIWPEIRDGKIIPQPQDEAAAVYHSKNEIDFMDQIELNDHYTAKDLINKLRARSFGNKGFAYFIENGRRYYLNIKISESNNFDNKS